MNILIERSDLSVLVLHLNIMRNNIKKGFKTNYGVFEGKKKIKVFDETKEHLVNVFEQEEHSNEHEIELEDEQIDMLHSFINWYVPELQKQKENEKDYKKNDILSSLERVKGVIDLIAVTEEM